MAEKELDVLIKRMGDIAKAAGYTTPQVHGWARKIKPPAPDVTIGHLYRGWEHSRLLEMITWCRKRDSETDKTSPGYLYRGIRRGVSKKDREAEWARRRAEREQTGE